MRLPFRLSALLLLLFPVLDCAVAFCPRALPTGRPIADRVTSLLHGSEQDDASEPDDENNDKEDVPPGQMRVSEIKA